ncbi:hypothetical protein CVT24_009598 [Panaeolus cyanescens]|uniref:Uncharacterized protein n=1 Tax=Panaeolus cyanescens TaxID=181874 RepID=A0A409YA83_9AGAR|nr:hypothetical protein CVT24_009598 [Panaeolus cyanescens]
MQQRPFQRSLVAQVAKSIKKRSNLVNSRSASSLSLSPHVSENSASNVASTSSSAPILNAQRSRLNDLKDAVRNKASPSAVWGTYTNVLSTLGADGLPLELHQEVLRKCTPADSELRAAAVKRLAAGNIPSFPHIHEARFQTVMRNIRSLGSQPNLEDYNFILQQFAAVGHYEGSYQVYKEIIRVGHIPSNKTFGLCFQSIAYRLSLPISKSKRPGVIKQIDAMYALYMDDMKKHAVPMTAVNFELSLRVLKHTLNREGFEKLMRWGYGIDLSNPDRVALEYGPGAAKRKDGNLVKPFPFTTSALNTTLDMLGRLGDISKLVQAFEVLTQPLSNAGQHFFNSFDEDDFGIDVAVSPTTRFAPPYAQPNTTTYAILLRHIGQTPYQSVFTRHYLLQAIHLDRFTDMTLRRKYWAKTPLEEISSPHFSLNRGLLLSVLGQSNKHKDLGLMNWLSSKMAYVLRKKKADLEFYKQVKEARDKANREGFPAQSTSRQLLGVRGTLDQAKERKEDLDIFDLDVSSVQPPELSEPKSFNVDLHVQILERNVLEIEQFAKRLEYVLGRTTQRVKERLGRRVWAGKDVFFMDQGKRVKTTRERWKEIVNFKDRTDTFNDKEKKRYGTPLNKVQRGRSFSTMAWSMTSPPALPTPLDLLRQSHPALS